MAECKEYDIVSVNIPDLSQKFRTNDKEISYLQNMKVSRIIYQENYLKIPIQCLIFSDEIAQWARIRKNCDLEKLFASKSKIKYQWMFFFNYFERGVAPKARACRVKKKVEKKLILVFWGNRATTGARAYL